MTYRVVDWKNWKTLKSRLTLDNAHTTKLDILRDAERQNETTEIKY